MIATMMDITQKLLTLIVLFALGAACTSLPQSTLPDDVCRSLIARVDLRIEDQGVADAQAVRMPGFPYLRINRFLASFKRELGASGALNASNFDEWVQRLRGEDRQARQIELQNLGAADIVQTIDACAERLLAQDRQAPSFSQAVIAAARAPRHYDDAVRAIGLYPLSQIGVALGFERWKEENLQGFQNPATLKDEASIREVHYGLAHDASLTTSEMATLIDLASNNSLGIPDLDGQLLADIAAQFSPVFAVTEITAADRVGRPFWPSKSADAPLTDADDPTLYVRLAHTRFEGEVLPQLIYTIWFPARPVEGAFDLLGGMLDGFVWRVTLDRDAKPLIYDGFHACGCYHLFFPTSRLARVVVPEDGDLREEPLVPRNVPDTGGGQRIVLHLAGGSHYLTSISVTADASNDVSLRMVDEHVGPDFGLRSLAFADGDRRSLFGPDGIIPGTERRERFILWPMGIANPGAMRQWGTHATAFVGERHADDPYLFERAFAR